MRSIPLEVVRKLNEQILAYLANASDADLAAIAEDRVEVVIRPKKGLKTTTGRNNAGEAPAQRLDQATLIATMNELKQLSTREQGVSLLQDRCKVKDDLLQLARAIDIPIPKDATVERTRNFIVEATIGFRIRSNAIQNKQ
jgi:hypothetical protein